MKTDGEDLVRNILEAAGVKLKKPKKGKHKYEPKYVCEYCGKGFAGRTNYGEHLRVHTREKPYGCQHCGKYFAQKSQLNLHLRIHNDEKSFQCDFCGMKYRRKEDLQNHVYTHIELIAFTCNECSRGFKSRHLLKQHIVCHQRGDYPCTGCTRTYSYIHSLKKHMQYVENYGTHDSTGVIGKGSKSSHCKSPSPITCDYCQKSFNRRDHLIQHIRIHTRERPYACEICNRKFTQSAVLKTHLRVHTGERPFGCELCKTRFSQKPRLLYHLKHHHNQLNNHGSDSNKYVATPVDLMASTSTEHAETLLHSTNTKADLPVYSCCICNEQFPGVNYLMRHVTAEHAISSLKLSRVWKSLYV